MPRKVNYGLDRDDDYDGYEDYDYAYDEEYKPDLDENGMWFSTNNFLFIYYMEACYIWCAELFVPKYNLCYIYQYLYIHILVRIPLRWLDCRVNSTMPVTLQQRPLLQG